MTFQSIVRPGVAGNVEIDSVVGMVGPDRITAKQWFARGERVRYDHGSKEILSASPPIGKPEPLSVFRLVDQPTSAEDGTAWVSFLPGWPDGSYGWSMVDRLLERVDIGPRLYFDYVGHGDSDKPLDYAYSTKERADLVEAFWAADDVRKTFVIAFDYSSIVTLELLSRQLERRERGAELQTEITGVLLANGGLFADAHSHPWYTTPMLNSPFGVPFAAVVQRSRRAFKELMKPLWASDFAVSEEEFDQLYDAIGRRDGVVALTKSAAFVDEHKANAERWDLERLYRALGKTVKFCIVGSEEDPFEAKQPIAARERLGSDGLDVRILPGGHLTTSEHPELLAEIIEDLLIER